MAPPRYTTNLNTIKLTFDFDTMDKLKACAKGRKVDATRCAYGLIQAALGARLPPVDAAPSMNETNEITLAAQRGFDAIKNYQPR